MLPNHRRLVILLTLTVCLVLVAGKIYYDTNTIEVRHYQVVHAGLGRVLEGLKVAHLSDLHIKEMGEREDRMLRVLDEEKPDLIFVTGDFIAFRQPYHAAMDFFKRLNPRLGMYAVLGNTEYSNQSGSCILCHEQGSRNLREKTKPVYLRNSSVPLKVADKSLNLIGVDDPVSRKSDLKTAMENLNPGDPSILLTHSPEIFEEVSRSGVDMVLSGHTHGGQLFITRYLRRIFPFHGALDYIDGFFQKGKTLLYVSRGMGTSFLPFRLGVKPEMTFFRFAVSGGSSTPGHEGSISNSPATTVFTGLSLGNLVETFNVAKPFSALFASSYSGHSRVLYDFESESDLDRLDWECHKWYERSMEHATSGKYCLKVFLPPGQYPGISFLDIPQDWSGSKALRMDVYNPDGESFKFHVRIDDHRSGWEYGDRFDINLDLKGGMNPLLIPTDLIRTNMYSRPMNLKKIMRMMVFVGGNPKPRELYIDNIRLE
jgi:uncharacterized protein